MQKDIERSLAWAKYCWPEKDWSTIVDRLALHFSNKVLCGRHFPSTQFIDKNRQKLSKFAVPRDVNEKRTAPKRKRTTPISKSTTPEPGDCDDDMKAEYLSDWESLEDLNVNTETAVNSNLDQEKQDEILEEIQEKIQKEIQEETQETNPPPETLTNNIIQKILSKSLVTVKKVNVQNSVTQDKNIINDVTVRRIINSPMSQSFDTLKIDIPEAAVNDDKPPVIDSDPLPMETWFDIDMDEQIVIVKDEIADDDHHQPRPSPSESRANADNIENEHTTPTVEPEGQYTLDNMTSIRTYGPCRCCLKKDVHRVADVPKLLECLKIAPCPDARVTSLVCSSCVKFLQEATRFRNMAAASEASLLAAIHAGKKPDKGSKADLFNQIDIPPPRAPKPPVYYLPATEERTETLIEETVEASPMSPGLPDDSAIEEVSQHNDEDRPDQSMDFSELSDDSDFGLDPKPYKEIEAQLTVKDIFNMLKSKPRKKVVMKNVRENLMTLLKNSTIVPFTFNKNPARSSEFVCIHHDGSFELFNELKEHIAARHTPEDYSYVQLFINQLPETILRADISCIKCKLCGVQVTDIDKLVEHLVKVHDINYHSMSCQPPHNILGFDLSTDVLKCPICDKVYSGFRALLAHMNVHYGAHLCHECGCKFIYVESYKKHLKKHMLNSIKPPQSMICDSCGSVLPSRGELMKHRRECQLNEVAKPPKVLKTKQVKRTKRRAVQKVNADEAKQSLQCVICNEAFLDNNDLFIHRLQHLNASKENSYKCDMCAYVTTQKKYFILHLKRHYDIKNYECAVCRKRFVSLKELRKHEVTHVVKFQCPLCTSRFANKWERRRHLKTAHSSD